MSLKVAEEFSKLQSRAAKAKAQADRSAVELEAALNELKEGWGVSDVDEAERLLEQNKQKLSNLERELEESLDLLREALDEFEGG